jgi:flagellar hook-basal body complex protein FliE
MDSIRLNSIELPSGDQSSLDSVSSSDGSSFADALGKAVGQVDKLQTDADAQAAQVASGGGNLHETALAMEKADISMRLLTRVRNKIVDAYQEVMRMSV